jgi:hypothetical protein
MVMTGAPFMVGAGWKKSLGHWMVGTLIWMAAIAIAAIW